MEDKKQNNIQDLNSKIDKLQKDVDEIKEYEQRIFWYSKPTERWELGTFVFSSLQILMWIAVLVKFFF